jgi:hypothetical protein
MTLNAITPSFLYLAAWLVLCGGAFMLFGFETGRRSIAALDEGFTDATPGRTLSAHAGGQD